MEAISKYFPSEISDDPDRISVLYAPFRDKTVNPKGYEAKLNTWQDAVFRYLREEKAVYFDSEDVVQAFSLRDKNPLCLNEVLAQMTRSKKLVTEDDFYNSLQANQKGWIPWAVGLGFDYLVRKPVATSFNWAWTSLLGASTSEKTKGSFVSPEIVEELSKKLCQLCSDESFQEKKDSAFEDSYDYDFLREETKSIIGDEKTLSIVLAYLHGNGKVKISQLTIANHAKTFVSFKDSPAKSSSKTLSTLVNPKTTDATTEKELTEKDKTLLQLTAISKELVREMEAIHSQMARLQDEARQYLAKGIRTLALNALKRKKLLQSKLEAREKSLDNIEIMISKLQDVDSNKMVYSAYKDAVAALNKSLTESDINSIEDTMEDIRDALDKQAELEEALSGSALRGANGSSQEDELELELEQILNGSGEEEEEEVALPDVPTDEVEDLLDKLCISPVKTEEIGKSNSRQKETAS